MLYVKDKEALLKRFPDLKEDIGDEPLGDPAELPFELGGHPWVIFEDNGFSINYDEYGTIEAVLVYEDGSKHIINEAGELYDMGEYIYFTKEDAIAGRDKLIDTMDWEKLYESLKFDIKNHPQEWGALLDKIRPLYKETTAAWAFDNT